MVVFEKNTIIQFSDISSIRLMQNRLQIRNAFSWECLSIICPPSGAWATAATVLNTVLSWQAEDWILDTGDDWFHRLPVLYPNCFILSKYFRKIQDTVILSYPVILFDRKRISVNKTKRTQTNMNWSNLQRQIALPLSVSLDLSTEMEKIGFGASLCIFVGNIKTIS